MVTEFPLLAAYRRLVAAIIKEGRDPTPEEEAMLDSLGKRAVGEVFYECERRDRERARQEKRFARGGQWEVK